MIPRTKYGATATEYNGVRYHSKREATYAQELDLRVRAHDVASWEGQVKMPIVVNGKHICNYIIDFVEVDKKGNKLYVEVKGWWTPEAKLKRKLFEALYPELRYAIVK